MNQSTTTKSEATLKESPIIVGLDIGTTKIAAIAGRKNEQGKLEILGFGQAPSNGVQHGQVLNIDQTIQAIKIAVGNCLRSNDQLEISEVYVGIAGHHIKSLQTRGDLVRQNSDIEITRAEIDQLIEDQRKTFIPAGDEIIDVIPQDFQVDNYHGIKNPIGYNGVKVGANFHIITGDKNAIRNIDRAVKKSDLSIKDLVLQPLASAAAVMSDVDMEAGVAILDIGGGTSDLAVFYEGVLKHTAVIPFGGENITNDIKAGLGVLKQQAEGMKKQFGSALADQAKENVFITIPGLRGMPARQISVKNLSNIIQARMTEILEFVTYHLKQIGMDHRTLNGGIIVTGGGSQLKHILQLTEYITGLNARIGYANEHLAPKHAEQLKDPMYATCLGLILKGIDDYENNIRHFNIPKKHIPQPPVLQEHSSKTTSENATIAESSSENPESENKNENPEYGRGGKKFRKLFENFKRKLIEMFQEEDDERLN